MNFVIFSSLYLAWISCPVLRFLFHSLNSLVSWPLLRRGGTLIEYAKQQIANHIYDIIKATEKEERFKFLFGVENTRWSIGIPNLRDISTKILNDLKFDVSSKTVLQVSWAVAMIGFLMTSDADITGSFLPLATQVAKFVRRNKNTAYDHRDWFSILEQAKKKTIQQLKEELDS